MSVHNNPVSELSLAATLRVVSKEVLPTDAVWQLATWWVQSVDGPCEEVQAYTPGHAAGHFIDRYNIPVESVRPVLMDMDSSGVYHLPYLGGRVEFE